MGWGTERGSLQWVGAPKHDQMYSLSQLRRGLSRGLSNPSFLGRELNRLYHRRGYTREYNTAGVDVMAEDWDTLVVLDACRYDLFEERSTLPGRLERRVSRGSHTREFLRGNFSGRTLEDTVYVSASPQLARLKDELDVTFHDVVDVWAEDGWDESVGTVRPETTTDYALQAHRDYPNKRIIVHYLQPHYPFLDADERLNVRTFGGEDDALDVWEALYQDHLDVPRELVREAYEHNFDAVVPSVERLLSAVDGTVVVTADHGNMLRERAKPVPVREWGHPPGIYTDALVSVPWLVVEGEQRRRITAEASTEPTESEATAVVQDRLAQLGYAE